MSEDFLSRWSRRKRTAAEETQDAKAPAREGEPVAERAPPVADSKPQAADAIAKPSEPPFDLASLPSIESITAATDVRPFLAPGVPADLARAALRRAWTADPAIRDFVGLAEYAWDYHKPGSMAGFGPLEMTDELRKVVARILGDLPDEPRQDPAAAPADQAQSTEIPSEIATLADGADTDSDAIEQGPASNRQDVAGNLKTPAEIPSKTTALQNRPDEYDIAPTTIRRGHGKALPK